MDDEEVAGAAAVAVEMRRLLATSHGTHADEHHSSDSLTLASISRFSPFPSVPPSTATAF